MGNGKTATMTRFLIEDYKIGYNLFSNYTLTDIPYIKYNSLQELVRLLPQFYNCSVSCDELQAYWDCYETPKKKDGTKDIKNFARQVRKRDVNFYYTSQTFSDIPNALRKVTQDVYMCSKYHDDGSLCASEKCKLHHWVCLTPLYPNKSGYEFGNSIMYELDTDIFNVYDTNEIIGFNDAYAYSV